MLARLEDTLELRPERFGARLRVGETWGQCAARVCGKVKDVWLVGAHTCSSGACDGLLRTCEAGEVTALAAGDLQQRVHGVFAVILEGKAARLTEAAEATPSHPPTSPCVEAVLLRNVGEGGVLGLDRRPMELRILGVSLILIDVEDNLPIKAKGSAAIRPPKLGSIGGMLWV